MAERDRCGTGRTFPVRLLRTCLALLCFSPLANAWSLQEQQDPDLRLDTVAFDGVPYLSVRQFVDAIGGHARTHPLKHKVELRAGTHTCVLTWRSPYLVLDDVAYRMPMASRLHHGVLHVPADAFLELLEPAVFRARGRVSVREPGPASPTRDDTTRTLSPPPQPEADLKLWTLDTIVIDPGHGGRDPGAIGPGKTREKDVVLRVAKRLKPLLEKKLRVRVVLTRDNDTFVPLHRRAEIAREKRGKIFVSLHCNASRKVRPRGAEVYFLSEAKTAEAADVARRENAVLELEGNGGMGNDGGDELDGIRFGLLSTQFLIESQELAALIRGEITQTVTDLDDRGVKQANFYVMRGTMGHMPSVLVEMGFISNPTEERRLRSTHVQKRLAEAIYRGLRSFKLRYEQQLSKK